MILYIIGVRLLQRRNGVKDIIAAHHRLNHRLTKNHLLTSDSMHNRRRWKVVRLKHELSIALGHDLEGGVTVEHLITAWILHQPN